MDVKAHVASKRLQNEFELQYLNYLNYTQVIWGMSGVPSITRIYASHIFKREPPSAIFSEGWSYSGGWLVANLQLLNQSLFMA